MGRSLGLSIRDLADGRRRRSLGVSRSLGLSITNLAHRRRGSGSLWGSLDLAIRDLGDRRSHGRCRNGSTRSGADLDLTITNLAHGDGNDRGVNLRLTVGDDSDDRGLNHAGTNGLTAVTTIATIASSVASSARRSDNLNGGALSSPVAVIQIVEVTREASVENSRAVQSKRAILAD